jgi:Ca-activated chloride channel family protein
MKMTAILLTSLTALFASTVESPPADLTLSGRIEDALTGQPVAGANVTAPGFAHTASSGRDGRYALSLPQDWAGSEITVKVEAPGYGDHTLTVQLSASGATLDVALTPLRMEVNEPAVIGEGETQGPAELWARVSADAVSGKYVRSVVQPVPRLRSDRDHNTESYDHIQENGFLATLDDALSTFSIDVDRASYSNIRRFLRQGQRPPIDVVRIEEMVNYFPYDYAVSDGDHPLTITTEVAPAPWQPEHRLVRIGIQAEHVDMENLPPNNLVFLLDVSGSMDSPDKLPLLKSALRMLVNNLRSEDRVAVVVYAGAAGLVLPSTSGADKEVILDAIEDLQAGGSTAGGAGLALAYAVAAENHMEGGNNRVILATDGDFNVGPSSDSEMIRLIEDKRRQGTFLSVLGFGTGNLKDSKMEQVADHGNGNYAYIDGVLEARKQLVTEMGGTLLTVAKDVKIQVEFNPATVRAYRLIGYENRLLAHEDFNDDTKDAGELGAGHSVTALYEVVPMDARTEVATSSIDPLRYQTNQETRRLDSDELLYVKLRYKAPSGSESRLLEQPVVDRPGRASTDLRFASAVAAFGMILRGSEHCGDFGLEDVAALASGALGDDAHGYRREFVRLVGAAQDLDVMATEVY